MKIRTTHHQTLIMTSLVLSIIFFFSFAFSQPQQQPSSVVLRDASENEILTGAEYYIVEATTTGDVGPGITLSPKPNDTCPTSIIQEPFNFLYGLPASFHLPNSKDNQVLRLSTDLNIKFEAMVSCAESTVWKVDGEHHYLTIGGEIGSSSTGCESETTTWFRVEKYGFFYKFVYCPNSVCEIETSKVVLCKDVGIFEENGVRRLGLTDGVPFMFLLVNKPSLLLVS